MRYLGNISGKGMLKCNGEEIARASYCFEGFFKESTGVTSCGEIRLSATVLKDVFGLQRAGEASTSTMIAALVSIR